MRFKQLMYQLTYQLIHHVFSLLELLFFSLKTVVDFSHALFYAPQTGAKTLLDKLKHVKKPPKHLTILLGQEQPSPRDLANLILWCMATRISYISFYDYKGSLKKTQPDLLYEVNKKKQPEDHVIWHDNPNTAYKNGFSGRKVHVKILTKEDGKLGVVNLCKNTTGKDFSIEGIDMALAKQFEFPDPELGFYCGDTFSLYDYPPWQIRITEFLNLRTHHNITVDVFIDNLLRYSKCEQRLGT